MKKVALLATMIALFCSSAFPVFSGEVTTRPKGQNKWEMLNQNGDIVGTLKGTEEGNYKFYNRGGGYVGLILHSGKWIPRDSRRSYTTITPEEAQLYLNALEAIKTTR
jgi:hypothetical protein